MSNISVQELKQKCLEIPNLDKRQQLIEINKIEKLVNLCNTSDYEKKQILLFLKNVAIKTESKPRFKFSAGAKGTSATNISRNRVNVEVPTNDTKSVENHSTVKQVLNEQEISQPGQLKQVGTQRIESSQINLENITNSVLILDAQYSIHLTNIISSKIYCKSQQLRMHLVKDCEVFTASNAVILEDCTSLTVKSRVKVVDFSFSGGYVESELDTIEFNKCFAKYQRYLSQSIVHFDEAHQISRQRSNNSLYLTFHTKKALWEIQLTD